MRTLNARQEKFVRNYINNGGDKNQAYAEAYGKSMLDQRVYCYTKSTDMIKLPHVAARIKELQALIVQKVVVKLEDHIRELEKLRDLAISDGKYAAAITAEVARGKVAGLYVEKVQCDQTITVEIMRFSDTASTIVNVPSLSSVNTVNREH